MAVANWELQVLVDLVVRVVANLAPMELAHLVGQE